MNLQQIVRDVISVNEEVGEFIRKEGENFDLSRIELKSSFNNLVSYVDKEAERKLVSALHKILPEAGFITEEGTVEQSKQHEYNWIIDPLDGTTNFLHGLPIFAISKYVFRQSPLWGKVFWLPDSLITIQRKKKHTWRSSKSSWKKHTASAGLEVPRLIWLMLPVEDLKGFLNTTSTPGM
jgi:3'-phosphoadenosine 5'-phosphosulfate (PAPS) 3'-phosphatase